LFIPGFSRPFRMDGTTESDLISMFISDRSCQTWSPSWRAMVQTLHHWYRSVGIPLIYQLLSSSISISNFVWFLMNALSLPSSGQSGNSWLIDNIPLG
jgi:hypothetical protein